MVTIFSILFSSEYDMNNPENAEGELQDLFCYLLGIEFEIIHSSSMISY